MATAVGMNFKMTASIAKFQASMDKVEEKLKNIEKSGKQTASGMKLLAKIEVGKLLVSGLTSVFGIMQSGVSTVTQFASEAAAAADAIGKLASSTGMAHEPLQVFQKIAQENGISGDKLGEALKRMTKRLAEAKMGFGEALPALELLGLNVEELAAMKPDQAFLKISAAIGQLPQKGDQAAAAFKIFSDQGLAMVPMFANLKASVKDTADEMLSLGQILSGTQIKNIEAMNDAFADVYKTAFSIGTQLLGNVAPVLKSLAKDATALVKAFEYNGSTGGQALANYLTDAFFSGAEVLAGWADSLIVALFDLYDSFSSVFSQLKEVAHQLGLIEYSDYELRTQAVQKLENEIAKVETAMGRYAVGTERHDSLTRYHADLVEKRNHAVDELNKIEQQAAAEREQQKVALGNIQQKVIAAKEEYERRVREQAGKASDLAKNLADSADTVPAKSKLLEEALAGLEHASSKATDPVELFGSANGIAGKELEKLAEEAEAANRTQKLTTEALTGMKDASKRATADVDLFGRENGIAGAELAKLARAEEQRRAATEAATAAEKRRKEFVEGTLGVWDKTANQLQRFYETLGYDPAWLEQKRKAEREAYESNLKTFYEAKKKRDEEIAERIRKREEAKNALEDKYEAKRQARAEKRRKLEEQAVKDYEAITKFSESLSGWWNGENGDGPDFPETEETLPELQTQTTTLGSILTAVQGFGANFVQATF